MDCRKTLIAAAWLFCAAAGCTPNKLMPVWPGGDSPAELNRPTASQSEATSEPVKELKPKTLVAMAAFREQMANEVAKTPAQKDFFLDDARKSYLRALSEDPNYGPAHLGLARHWEMVGEHDKAVASYEAALKLVPKDVGLLYEIGMCHARHKEWPSAVLRLQQASAVDPMNRQLASAVALALARAERIEDSLVALRKLHPDAEAQAQFTLARMLHQMEKDEQCRRHLDLAIQADPNFKPALIMLSQLNTQEEAAPAAVSQQ